MRLRDVKVGARVEIRSHGDCTGCKRSCVGRRGEIHMEYPEYHKSDDTLSIGVEFDRPTKTWGRDCWYRYLELRLLAPKGKA